MAYARSLGLAAQRTDANFFGHKWLLPAFAKQDSLSLCKKKTIFLSHYSIAIDFLVLSESSSLSTFPSKAHCTISSGSTLLCLTNVNKCYSGCPSGSPTVFFFWSAKILSSKSSNLVFRTKLSDYGNVLRFRVAVRTDMVNKLSENFWKCAIKNISFTDHQALVGHFVIQTGISWIYFLHFYNFEAISSFLDIFFFIQKECWILWLVLFK